MALTLTLGPEFGSFVVSLVNLVRCLRPSLPTLSAVLLLGFAPPGRATDRVILERDLVHADQSIAEAQSELDRALSGYDEEAIVAAGRRLRELKRRRDEINGEIVTEKQREYKAEITLLVRQRESMRSRLAELERRETAAAAAFDESPGPGSAARLRDLSLEIIRLKGDLDRADAFARASGQAGP